MIAWIDPAAPPDAFPPVDWAQLEPNGLLAAGGDLSPDRLVAAYRRGIFPWFSPGEPILWWSPDPRVVFRPERFHASRRLRRRIRATRPILRLDGDFSGVIRACAAPRRTQGGGTWISPSMITAYQRLFRRGVAHCAEALVDGRVVGGVYGLAIGRVFFGESMFSRDTDGSKIALYGLCGWLSAHGFRLLDGQVESSHLFSLGAERWERRRFLEALDQWCVDEPAASWGAASSLLG